MLVLYGVNLALLAKPRNMAAERAACESVETKMSVRVVPALVEKDRVLLARGAVDLLVPPHHHQAAPREQEKMNSGKR